MERFSPTHRVKRPETLFRTIARRYDLTNTILSVGLHHLWKRQALAAAAVAAGDRVLDAGTGTGDLAVLAARRGAIVAGVDVSLEMLHVARRRDGGRQPAWIGGDVALLPFQAASFDVVLTGFVLRHPVDLAGALAELRRVLAPGGRLVVLEFSRPRGALVRAAYRAYSTIIPAIGRWLTGDGDAYAYLVESIRRFPDQTALAGMLSTAGFEQVACRDLSGGIVAIHTGRAPSWLTATEAAASVRPRGPRPARPRTP